MQKVRLKTWDEVCGAAPKVQSNEAKSYWRIYYPDLTDFGAIRKFYIPYFGKDVYVQPRMKYGKPTRPDEYSVHTEKGVWLMNIHESWISLWYNRDEELIQRIATDIVSVQPFGGWSPENMEEAHAQFEKPKEKILPKPDFSHVTFEGLFEV